MSLLISYETERYIGPDSGAFFLQGIGDDRRMKGLLYFKLWNQGKSLTG